MPKSSGTKRKRVKTILIRHLNRYNLIAAIDEDILEERLPRIERQYRTIDSFDEDEIRIYFRFETKEQLHELKAGFKIPDGVKVKSGRTFSYSR